MISDHIAALMPVQDTPDGTDTVVAGVAVAGVAGAVATTRGAVATTRGAVAVVGAGVTAAELLSTQHFFH